MAIPCFVCQKTLNSLIALQNHLEKQHGQQSREEKDTDALQSHSESETECSEGVSPAGLVDFNGNCNFPDRVKELVIGDWESHDSSCAQRGNIVDRVLLKTNHVRTCERLQAGPVQKEQRGGYTQSEVNGVSSRIGAARKITDSSQSFACAADFESGKMT